MTLMIPCRVTILLIPKVVGVDNPKLIHQCQVIGRVGQRYSCLPKSGGSVLAVPIKYRGKIDNPVPMDLRCGMPLIPKATNKIIPGTNNNQWCRFSHWDSCCWRDNQTTNIHPTQTYMHCCIQTPMLIVSQ